MSKLVTLRVVRVEVSARFCDSGDRDRDRTYPASEENEPLGKGRLMMDRRVGGRREGGGGGKLGASTQDRHWIPKVSLYGE